TYASDDEEMIWDRLFIFQKNVLLKNATSVKTVLAMDGTGNSSGEFSYDSNTDLLTWSKNLFVSGTIETDTFSTGSLRLSGSSTAELLVIAQYISIVQDPGANKFELRLTGTFTGGTDTDYEIELENPPTTFKWRKDTGAGFGAFNTGVAIQVSALLLDEGIKIAFLDSGSDVFVAGDAYSFTALSSPTTIFNVDTQTPLVTADALSVTGATSMGDHLTMAASKNVQFVDSDVRVTRFAPSIIQLRLHGKDGIVFSNDASADIGSFDAGGDFTVLAGLAVDDADSTDAVITMDGTSNSPGTITYESDNDFFKIGAQSFSVDTDVLVVDAVADTVSVNEIKVTHATASQIHFQEGASARWRGGYDANANKFFLRDDQNAINVVMLNDGGGIELLIKSIGSPNRESLLR
ncbi:hypothetical protein LCGC14_2813230, partial [marine sediment metagenome]